MSSLAISSPYAYVRFQNLYPVSGDHRALLLWEKDNDAPILDRLMCAIVEEGGLDAVSTAAHRALFQALQQFRHDLPSSPPDPTMVNEMLESFCDSSDTDSEAGSEDELSGFTQQRSASPDQMGDNLGQTLELFRDTEADPGLRFSTLHSFYMPLILKFVFLYDLFILNS